MITGTGYTKEDLMREAAEAFINLIPGLNKEPRSSNPVKHLMRVAFDLHVDIEFTMTHVTEMSAKVEYGFLLLYGKLSARGFGTSKECTKSSCTGNSAVALTDHLKEKRPRSSPNTDQD